MSDATFHFAPTPIRTRVIQVIGISCSAFLTGYIFSFSFIITPLIKLAATPATQETLWAKVDRTSTTTVPLVAALSWISFVILALNAWKCSPANYAASSKRMYTGAAGFVLFAGFFNLFFLCSTNADLSAKSIFYESNAGVVSGAEPNTVIARWTLLNYVRCLLPLLSTLLGAFAAVGRPEVIGLVIGGSNEKA